VLTLSACVACALLVAPQASLAVINDPENGPTEGPCPLGVYDFKLEGNLVVVGIPLAGTQVQINATSAKLIGRKGGSSTAARICDTLLFSVDNLAFRWSVRSGPSATFANANTLSPGVNLGGVGTYKVRLTACPSECKLTNNGKSKNVGPFTRDVTINAVSEFAPPPETEPILPPLFAPGTEANPPGWSGPTTAPPRFSDSQRDNKCNGDGGFKDPQWVTAEPFAGPGNYRTVEGAVKSSRVSSADDFLNHDSQDQNWDVKPDPPYFGLTYPKLDSHVEMEWETNSMPREFRPTPGDRTSTVGYWILDCGHKGFRGEIHPPVGIAVERPRAVPIPSDPKLFAPAGFPNGFGSGLQVPGITTDIFFNRKSGETTRNCSRTGLHSPSLTPNSPNLFARLPFCVREPHALNRSFTFNVYLPRNPQLRAQELGLSPPPVPVFVGVEKLGRGTGGPEPTTVVRQGGGATWVEVTVDLSSLPASETQYARRVSAAWAYPNPANWGARRWRVRLNTLKVINNSEWSGRGGDWRFFFNTNNRDREWTKVFDCDFCIDDGDRKKLNTETGSSPGSSSGLGPDLVLFPGQFILVHTGGFDDEVDGDDIGTVYDRISQSSPDGAGNYTGFSNGGTGVYRLNYGIGGGASIARANLTPEAANLLNAYTVRAKPRCTFTQAQAAAVGQNQVTKACVISPELLNSGLIDAFDPGAFVLGKRVQKEKTLSVFDDDSQDEPFTLHGISPERLRAQVDSLRKTDPKLLNAILDDIKQELRAVPAKLRRDYFELVATLDFALPKSLRGRPYPAGFRKQVEAFPVRLR